MRRRLIGMAAGLMLGVSTNAAAASLAAMPVSEHSDLSAFEKWTSVLIRHDARAVPGWQALTVELAALDERTRLDRVNAVFNRVRYVPDADQWGRGDYWATPAEFVRGAGDCEDYAIAKYLALREAGVPAEALRLVIVRDRDAGGIVHAVLAVAAAGEVWILDNQEDRVLPATAVTRYVPIYAINEERWWYYG